MSMERRLDAIENRLGTTGSPAAEVIVCPLAEVPESEPERSAYFDGLMAARGAVRAILLPDNGRSDRLEVAR
jgi:hypothetical protein